MADSQRYTHLYAGGAIQTHIKSCPLNIIPNLEVQFYETIFPRQLLSSLLYQLRQRMKGVPHFFPFR